MKTKKRKKKRKNKYRKIQQVTEKMDCEGKGRIKNN
jgi:hypothetical protein